MRARNGVAPAVVTRTLRAAGKERTAFDQIAVFHSGEAAPCAEAVFERNGILCAGLDQITSLVFHPYEDLLFGTDCKDGVGCVAHTRLASLMALTRLAVSGTTANWSS